MAKYPIMTPFAQVDEDEPMGVVLKNVSNPFDISDLKAAGWVGELVLMGMEKDPDCGGYPED